jgi:hypothetical protein
VANLATGLSTLHAEKLCEDSRTQRRAKEFKKEKIHANLLCRNNSNFLKHAELGTEETHGTINDLESAEIFQQ